MRGQGVAVGVDIGAGVGVTVGDGAGLGIDDGDGIGMVGTKLGGGVAAPDTGLGVGMVGAMVGNGILAPPEGPAGKGCNAVEGVAEGAAEDGMAEGGNARFVAPEVGGERGVSEVDSERPGSGRSRTGARPHWPAPSRWPPAIGPARIRLGECAPVSPVFYPRPPSCCAGGSVPIIPERPQNA